MRNLVVKVLAGVVCAGLVPVCSAGSGRETAKERRARALEMLDKFAEKREKVISFIVNTKREGKFKTKSKLKGPVYNGSGTVYSKCEFRCDATRGKESFYLWGNVSIYHPDVSEEQAHYTSNLWDGEKTYWYNRIGPPHPGSLIVRRGKDPGVPKWRTQLTRGHNIVGEMMGYHWGDDGKRVDEILARAKNFKLRQEKLRGVDCYVIDAVVRGKGKYTVWIDPIHDYHIAKIHVRRKKNDKVGRKKLKKNDYTNEIYEISRFQQIENLWFPEEYKVKRTNYYAETGTLSIGDRVINLTNIILNPDHDGLRSFMPDDIPNGASVRIIDVENDNSCYNYLAGDGPQYKWIRGARYVVDDKGRVVSYDPNEELLPVVKTLPPLKYYKIKKSPRWSRDKMVLVCFWCMYERPSEDCVQRLGKRAKPLAERGVQVILVHVRGTREERVNSWLKEHEIDFATGLLDRDNIYKVRRAWGAKRLPWLILTDKEHIVTAEGFSLEEKL